MFRKDLIRNKICCAHVAAGNVVNGNDPGVHLRAITHTTLA
jgi:hypothetical protein